MHEPSPAQTGRAAAVAPAIQPNVPWRVRTVEPLPSARLRVTFIDGTEGFVELERFLGAARVKGTVFAALRDPDFFNSVRVVLGAVEWPNGADLAPDAMYDAIRDHGCWVVADN